MTYFTQGPPQVSTHERAGLGISGHAQCSSIHPKASTLFYCLGLWGFPKISLNIYQLQIDALNFALQAQARPRVLYNRNQVLKGNIYDSCFCCESLRVRLVLVWKVSPKIKSDSDNYSRSARPPWVNAMPWRVRACHTEREGCAQGKNLKLRALLVLRLVVQKRSNHSEGSGSAK